MMAALCPSVEPPASAGNPPARFRVAVEFAVEDDLRFLSHRDEVRLLTRAVTRAGWPLAYSKGFNPRPRLTVPLPRTVGMAAMRQIALIDLAQPRSSTELHTSLRAQLPPGYDLHRVISPASRRTPHAEAVTYHVELDEADARSVEARLTTVLGQRALPVTREHGPDRPSQPIDIRPYIDQLELDGCQLRLRLLFVEQRTARPSEVITKLGLAADAYNHRIRRGDVHWNLELAGPQDGPVTHERNQVGKEENHEEHDAPHGRDEEDG